jgi:hypothetical protein
LYNEKGELDPIIQVLLNGKEWITGDQLDTALQNGDSLVFMMMAGG